MALLNPPFQALPLDEPLREQAEPHPLDKREQNRLAQQRFRQKHKAPNEQAAAAWVALQDARAVQAGARAAYEVAKSRTAALKLVWEQACREQS